MVTVVDSSSGSDAVVVWLLLLLGWVLEGKILLEVDRHMPRNPVTRDGSPRFHSSPVVTTDEVASPNTITPLSWMEDLVG